MLYGDTTGMFNEHIIRENKKYIDLTIDISDN